MNLMLLESTFTFNAITFKALLHLMLLESTFTFDIMLTALLHLQ